VTVEIDLRVVTDHLEVEVPAGSRVLVVSDMHLTAEPAPATGLEAQGLIGALESWSGPGTIVLAGDVFELIAGDTDDPRPALAAHGRLAAALEAFSAGPGRRLVCLVGNHDGRLAWDGRAALAVAEQTGAELALAADLLVETDRGRRRVRVEHGHRFDPANAFTDPRDPLDVPLGHHLVRHARPALDAAGRSWLADVEHLADPADLPSFIFSRLAYRRLSRHFAWLALPLLLALLVKVPLAIALTARVSRGVGLAPWPHRLLVFGVVLTADVALVAAVLALAARQAWRALATSVLAGRGHAQNDAPRAEARALVAGGYAGLITGHTHHAELSDLGGGFYANCGCWAEVVCQHKARLGLPPVFLPHLQLSWVELEAGADLHVRLFQGKVGVPGRSLMERLVVHSPTARPSQPSEVAAWPRGPSWPASSNLGGRAQS
jgi:UDP-2,3-diacylglucosamine pyrophosphatase LpxH